MGVFIQVNEDSPFAEKYPLGYVVQENGCWEWVGCCGWNGSSQFPGRGYGTWKGKPAHRVMYEKFRGPIAPGLVCDHLCRNRACVNPDHIEPVTQHENLHRIPLEVRTQWHRTRIAEGWIPYQEQMKRLEEERQLEADLHADPKGPR